MCQTQQKDDLRAATFYSYTDSDTQGSSTEPTGSRTTFLQVKLSIGWRSRGGERDDERVPAT